MISENPPIVFFSYTHDSEEHKESVLQYSDRLIIEEGIQSWIDRYIEDATPSEGWPAWMSKKVRQSDYVLVVCTEIYLKRFNGEEVPGRGKGLGGTFESFLVQNQIYQDGTINRKFIPVVLQQSDREFIPAELQPYTNYCLTSPGEFEGLIRRLTDQPKIVRPDVGKMRVLPPENDVVTNPVIESQIEVTTTVILPPEASQPRMIEFYQAMPPNLKLMQAFFEKSYTARIALARKLGLLELGEPEPEANKDRFSAQLLLRAKDKNVLGGLWHLLFDETIDPNPYHLL